MTAGNQIVLESSLPMATARPLAEAFLAARGAAVTVNAEQVEHVGAQALQVLLAAAKTWAADGQALIVAPRSDAFNDCLERLGIDPTSLPDRENTA